MIRNHIKPSAIIFDFDDTLVNAKPIINKALSATFSKFNISEEIIAVKNIDVNRSLRDYFCHIFADNIAEARDAYYSYYTEFANELTMLDHSEEVLKLLHHHNVFTAIVSNKGGPRLRSEVQDKFAWHNYFAAIIGSGDAKEDKPSPMPAQLALEKANLSNYNDVWFIGDSLVDLQTAKNLGCKGILFGKDDHSNTDAHFSVANHAELLKLLQGIYV